MLNPSQLENLFSELKLPQLTLEQKFPEWLELQRLSRDLSTFGRINHLGESSSSGHIFPLLSYEFGSTDPNAPTLLISGGVHGLERIGSQVVLSLMHSFQEMLLWDTLIHESLKKIRIAFFPIVNPWGIFNQTRSNPNGVDLMRNAPVEADPPATWLVAGQRLSPRLPWYRGDALKLEEESLALLKFSREQTRESIIAISLDVHSGFGTNDQIWFPYASSSKPFEHLAEFHALKNLFEKTHPHHFYKIEPQAKNYTTHGDLWDYAYQLFLKEKKSEQVFLPLALEMGSWLWVKKNPLQLLSALGPFNPIVPHRTKRILRRHNTLFDFLIRALCSYQTWVPKTQEQKLKHHEQSLALWYNS